jgi:hypothetical protein
LTREDLQNLRRFNGWLFLWAVVFLAATFLLRRSAAELGSLAWLVAAVPTIAFLLALRAYVRFLNRADELTRKIHLEALAMGFAVGVLFGFCYRLLERAGAPHLDISDVLLPMVVAWSFGIVWGHRRYA